MASELIRSENKRSLGNLPAELLYMIAALMPLDDLKEFSTTSKRLRAASLPTLFRSVGFTFSQHGLEEMECFAQSDIRKHVDGFKYTVPKLLSQRKNPRHTYRKTNTRRHF